MKIEPFLDHERVLANQTDPVHFGLKLEAHTLQHPRPRPAAFCVVMDRSGSMEGEPMARAREAARLAVGNLRKDDLFSLVVFDNEVDVVHPLGTVQDKARVQSVIDGIHSRGSTNLSGGWMRGREEQGGAPDGVSRRLLLLSDGLLNQGIVEPELVVQLAAQGLETAGIRTSCLGFGDSYQEDLMSRMAQVTNGNFYDATRADSLPAIFDAELDGLQKVAVQNLRVRIKALDFCEELVALGPYPCKPLADGWREYSVGDLVSEEERVLCYGLKPATLPVVNGRPVVSLEGEKLLEVELVWDEIHESGVESKTFRQVVRIQATQDPGEVRLNGAVLKWVATQRAGQVISMVTEAMDRMDIREAQRLCEKAEADLGRYGDSPEIREARDQLVGLKDRITGGHWDARARKEARYLEMMQRKMGSDELFTAEAMEMPFFKKRRPRPSRPESDPDSNPSS